MMTWYKRMKLKLFFQTLHRRVACALLFHHKWGELEAMGVYEFDAPEDAEPVFLLGYMRQCERCYHVDVTESDDDIVGGEL